MPGRPETALDGMLGARPWVRDGPGTAGREGLESSSSGGTTVGFGIPLGLRATFAFPEELSLVHDGRACVLDKGGGDIICDQAPVRLQRAMQVLGDTVSASNEYLFIFVRLKRFAMSWS
jgi:hypothetical protein